MSRPTVIFGQDRDVLPRCTGYVHIHSFVHFFIHKRACIVPRYFNFGCIIANASCQQRDTRRDMYIDASGVGRSSSRKPKSDWSLICIITSRANENMLLWPGIRWGISKPLASLGRSNGWALSNMRWGSGAYLSNIWSSSSSASSSVKIDPPSGGTRPSLALMQFW